MSENKKKTWLVLAHCFNMDGRAASQTITDRIPLLLENGVTPVVLSAPTGKKDTRFPHYQIMSPAPSGVLFETRQIIEKSYTNVGVVRLLKVILTILCLPFYLIEKIFINLDSHWSWFISAAIRGWFIAREYKPELIYSTAGPSSTHLAGFLLKRILGLPWVAEIHDPLISEYEERRYQRYSFHKWLERKIFYNANAVLYFTEVALHKAVDRINVQDVGYVLRPGANPPAISEETIYQKRDKIHFGHFGSLSKDRNLHDFMTALVNVFEKKSTYREKIVLDIYGTTLDEVSERSLVEFGLQDVVRVHGRLESDSVSGKSGRLQVVEQMHLSDVLLLVHGDTKACLEYIPSKLYEYLLTNRPIVGVVAKNSELMAILSKGGHYAKPSGDIENITKVIEDFVVQWDKDIEGIPSIKNKTNFTVERTVNKLLRIVEKVSFKDV